MLCQINSKSSLIFGGKFLDKSQIYIFISIFLKIALEEAKTLYLHTWFYQQIYVKNVFLGIELEVILHNISCSVQEILENVQTSISKLRMHGI